MADITSTVVLAVKAALAPLQAQQAATEQRCKALEGQLEDLGRFRERLAVIESRPPVPGPPGPPGVNGKDGVSGWKYLGVFMKGATYVKGDSVTWNGSLWHANEDIGLQVPGDGSKAWTLMVKHGGKDLRDDK